MFDSDIHDKILEAGVTDLRYALDMTAGTVTYADDYPDAQKTLIEGVVSAYSYSDVTALQRKLKRAVNNNCDTKCAALITGGVTQQKRYDLKLAQAVAYQADSAPTEDNYPDIYGEVGITADTAAEVAAAIVAQAAKVNKQLRAYELIRKKGIAAIEAATTTTDVQAAYDAISWT